MAGYNHSAGMSNNAVSAYGQGIKPLSKITAADLRRAGIEGVTLKHAKALAKSGAWPASEWHHSGGTWYNKVDFYDPAELAELISDGDVDLEGCAEDAQDPEETRVTGTYTEFVGRGKRCRMVGDVNFEGVLRGDWIHLDAGGRKKASGNHIVWRKVS